MKTYDPFDHIKVSGFKLPSSFLVVPTNTRVVAVVNHILKTYVMDDSYFYKMFSMRVGRTVVFKCQLWTFGKMLCESTDYYMTKKEAKWRCAFLAYDLLIERGQNMNLE